MTAQPQPWRSADSRGGSRGRSLRELPGASVSCSSTAHCRLVTRQSGEAGRFVVPSLAHTANPYECRVTTFPHPWCRPSFAGRGPSQASFSGGEPLTLLRRLSMLIDDNRW